MELEIVNDPDHAVQVMRDAASWLAETGTAISFDWEPAYLTLENLSRVATLDEFYVGIIDREPAVAAIVQRGPFPQDWSIIDRGSEPDALYFRWLSVTRQFAGRGLPSDFINQVAKDQDVALLRLDTDATNEKLMSIYSELGFTVAAIVEQSGTNTALLERHK